MHLIYTMLDIENKMAPKSIQLVFVFVILIGIIVLYMLFYIEKEKFSQISLTSTKNDIFEIWKTRKVPFCDGIIQGNQDAIKKALLRSNFERDILKPEDYINLLTKNSCVNFIKIRNYKISSTKEETSFPVAFSILVYKDIEQVERLLRMIYSPSNYYCIHIDKNAPYIFKYALQKITDCFNNVFLTEETYPIYWGHFNILKAEMSCLKLLYKKQWKYFINLTGQEVPLVTNQELVKILTAFNGANNVARSFHLTSDVKNRWKYRWEFVMDSDEQRLRIRTSGHLKRSPPHNITILKGSTHVALSRKFVKFILKDKRAIDFYNWLNDTYVSDESFFSTLNGNPHLCPPGGFSEKDKYPGFITRYKLWITRNETCGGKYVRGICIFGIKDVKKLVTNSGSYIYLFANKMYYVYEHLAYDCFEEYHRNRVLSISSQNFTFDDKWIRQLNFVKNIVNCTT